MKDSHITSIAQLKAFLKLNAAIKFKAVSLKEKYAWIDEVLTKFQYLRLTKRDKGIVRSYIIRMTGLSKAQLDRLIARKRDFGKVFVKTSRRHTFPRKYDAGDIGRLVETDNIHKRLSGQATKTILAREWQIFHRPAYEKISQISVAHLYNLRETRQYRSHSTTFRKTQKTQVAIGQRKKPQPQGSPGFLRVDTVHQGDYGKRKGLYHVNIVDEVTQWEVVGAVEKISEHYLIPLLEDLLSQLPFVVVNFHSDNGSEYVNKTVAKLLNKLLIEQTKSRSRHCNDNALAECKNGAVIRKRIGYLHLPQQVAPAVNQFYRDWLNAYLNYHRPCGFASIVQNKKGKVTKIYRQKDYRVPYEKLKALKQAASFLKKDVSFAQLDKIAYAMSDNEFGTLVQKAQKELFKNFKNLSQEMISFNTFISASSLD